MKDRTSCNNSLLVHFKSKSVVERIIASDSFSPFSLIYILPTTFLVKLALRSMRSMQLQISYQIYKVFKTKTRKQIQQRRVSLPSRLNTIYCPQTSSYVGRKIINNDSQREVRKRRTHKYETAPGTGCGAERRALLSSSWTS